MKPFVVTLSSSSGGNATLISDSQTHFLIDAGISAKKIAEFLQTFHLKVQDLQCVLVTHEHSDHILGLEALHLPVYASKGTCDALTKSNPHLDLHETTETFEIGRIGVLPFPLPHDCALKTNQGYMLRVASQRIAYCSDFGFLPKRLMDLFTTACYLLIESNYDNKMLIQGPYSEALKRRIQGSYGHFSNVNCADVVAQCAKFGLRRATLIHLSQTNNRPELAYETVSKVLIQNEILPGRDIELDVAPRSQPGRPYVG